MADVPDHRSVSGDPDPYPTQRQYKNWKLSDIDSIKKSNSPINSLSTVSIDTERDDN